MTRSAKAKRKGSRNVSSLAAATISEVDWDSSVDVKVDPVLVESIRARQELKQITLRIGQEQIAEARRVAAQTGIPYQSVLRRWLAEGASLSRALRKAG